MRAALLALFAISCAGGVSPQDLTQGLTSDDKLAVVLKRYQFTTCKTTCLIGERVEQKYTNPDTGEAEVWRECPLDYREFLCIDLYKQDGAGNHVFYKLSPQEWQESAAHLFGFYSHEQIKSGIAQIEFLCEQDFSVCENHFEPLKALKDFYYERGGVE